MSPLAYISDPLSEQGQAFARLFNQNLDFLQMRADLNINEAMLLGIIAHAKQSATKGHLRYEEVMNIATELALPLLKLLEENRLMETPSEQELARTVLERILSQSRRRPVAGALLRGGKTASHRLIYGSILMECGALGLQMTPRQFSRISLLADENISLDAAEKHFKRATKNPPFDNLPMRNAVIAKALLDYAKATLETEENILKKEFCHPCNRLIL